MFKHFSIHLSAIHYEQGTQYSLRYFEKTHLQHSGIRELKNVTLFIFFISTIDIEFYSIPIKKV